MAVYIMFLNVQYKTNYPWIALQILSFFQSLYSIWSQFDFHLYKSNNVNRKKNFIGEFVDIGRTVG